MSEKVWAVRQSYGFEAIEVVKETDQTVSYRQGSRKSRTYKIDKVAFSYGRGGVLPWRGSEAESRKIAEKLTSAGAAKDQRIKAAKQAFSQKAEAILADATRLTTDTGDE